MSEIADRVRTQRQHPHDIQPRSHARVREDREAERLERMALTESIKAMAESNRRGNKDA